MKLLSQTLIFATTIAAMLPSQSKSQHSPTTLSCAIWQSCDAVANCQATDRSIEFVMSPIRTGLHGEGTYQLNYDGNTTEATIVTGIGLWMWDEGTDVIHTMQATGTDEALWVRRSMSPPITSEIVFLNCGDED